MIAHSQSPHLHRQSLLVDALQTSEIAALVLNPGPSLMYLTGLNFHLMERPVIAIFTPHRPTVIFVPELEQAKTENLPYDVQVFPYGEDPATWQSQFGKATRAAGLGDNDRVGVEPRQLRLLELWLLEGASPRSEIISAQHVVASLRMRKDDAELEAMQKAVEIAQAAIQETIPLIKVGMTEKEIAAELTLHMLRKGSEPEIPFSPIVSSGPNSANPHATPTQRRLAPGDCLVIDWGATYNGYISDITRTFAVSETDEEMQRIARIVAEANAAGRDTAGPGITADVVDRTTRQVIEAAGYGQYFIHRTGHGIGLESHEDPYIRSGNQMVLAPGMTFTVEPGIYLPNRNGVRIEDNVVITEIGAQSLTDLTRELVVVG
ncbi:MAG: M24 family metallopeptidase [Anaerolineales bacterium]